jgi:hypothetical protein
VDIEVQVTGRTHYPDYEVLLAAYFASGFKPGAYVSSLGGPQQIRPVHHPVFDGMYLFFPRDEESARLHTDGRGRRGRWPWRMLPARCYAHPVGFYSDGSTDALLMGRREDVFSVGMAYAGDEAGDAVAGHRSLYLSLFGRDLHPGEGWQTQARLVVDDLGADPARHLAEWERFQQDVSGLDTRFQVEPM